MFAASHSMPVPWHVSAARTATESLLAADPSLDSQQAVLATSPSLLGFPSQQECGRGLARSWPHRLASFCDAASGRSQQQRFWGAAAPESSATAPTGGCTPCDLAQASRSACVWQQQLVQHCSALRHPHLLSMQGNGCERSFLTTLGSGTPLATSKYIPANSQTRAGKRNCRR